MTPVLEPWMINIIIAAIAASGAWVAALITLRGKSNDERQVLIDQIQEERNWQAEERRKERVEFAAELIEERKQITAERAAAATAADRYWSDKSKSREYVAMLRAHIINLQPPPPPLPPAGYLE